MSALSGIRHRLALLLPALWWGGFTFYAGRVVFIGHEVLRSKVRQGFITERVTTELNWLAVAVLAVTAWELAGDSSVPSPRRRGRWLTWCAFLLTTLALFALHTRLAGMLDFAARTVVDDDRFYGWHRAYLWVAAVQWLAGLALLPGVGRDRR